VNRLACTICLAFVGVLIQGCPQPVDRPPVTPAEYNAMGRGAGAYPPLTIKNYNLRRIWDETLSSQERIDSLHVVMRVAENDPDLPEQLAAMLGKGEAPVRLHYAVLEFLLRKGDPAVATYAVKTLEKSDLPSSLRDAILQWLMQHPRPEVLAQVVKLWAQEPSTTGPNESRFRQIVQQITGRDWQTALVEGINAEAFFARGSAVEVLRARVATADLKRAFMALSAQVPATRAIQTFVQRLDYLPDDRTELLSAAYLYSTRRALIPDAAELARTWGRWGYAFEIRDFHLLSRLARDPLRKHLHKAQLVADLTGAFAGREHLRRSTAGIETNDFSTQADRLTMADLWNLYLLNEMLKRPRVQRALGIMSRRDRADTRSAWGGLVFYESGQAEAKLYPADTARLEDDLHHVSSEHLDRHGHDALCRFHGHFEKAENAARAGPDEQELRQARAGSYYGLVLTSVSQSRFAAHYYTPQGVVVSLGAMPFAQ